MLSDVTVLAAALSRPDYAHCALCCARLAGGNFLPCAGAGTGPGQVLTHSWAGMGRVTTTITLHPAQPLMYCNNVLHEHMMQKQKHILHPLFSDTEDHANFCSFKTIFFFTLALPSSELNGCLQFDTQCILNMVHCHVCNNCHTLSMMAKSR